MAADKLFPEDRKGVEAWHSDTLAPGTKKFNTSKCFKALEPDALTSVLNHSVYPKAVQDLRSDALPPGAK